MIFTFTVGKRILALAVLLGIGFSGAFAPHPLVAGHRQHNAVLVEKQRNGTPLRMSIFEGVNEPVQNYVNIWTPLFEQAKQAGIALEVLLHWGHGGAMASVLLSMGLIGAWMGWQIRLGNGNEVNALTLGETMREAHPKIIGGALFFFLLGGQGGLVLLASQGQPILESPHAVSAVVVLSLMGIQAILPQLFETGGQLARNAHAYLGTATIAALFVHLATGVNLGLSF
jgi:hypothetical protein